MPEKLKGPQLLVSSPHKTPISADSQHAEVRQDIHNLTGPDLHNLHTQTPRPPNISPSVLWVRPFRAPAPAKMVWLAGPVARSR